MDYLSIEIIVNEVTYSIDVMRPAHNQDGLHIRFDEQTVGSVLHCLRNSTFSQQHHHHHAHAPGFTGIHKRRGMYMVSLASPAERVKYATAKSVEDAKACVKHHQQELSEIGEQVGHQRDGVSRTILIMHERSTPNQVILTEMRGVVSEIAETDAGMSSMA